MCSSGREEYDSSGAYSTACPASLSGNSTNNINTQFGPFFSLISQSHHQNPNFFINSPPNYLHTPTQPSVHLPLHPPFSSTSSSLPSPSLFSANETVGGGGGYNSHHQEHDDGVGGNKPKKRNRASRRAPTTVITTDTSNFRSMVREFTGIPSPPSSAASLSRRFHPFRPSPRHLLPPNNNNPSSLHLPSSSLSTINTIATKNNNNNNIALPHNNNNVLDPTLSSSSHQDLGFAFQTPLPTTLINPKSQPSSSGSEWPVSVTRSWPSHF